MKAFEKGLALPIYEKLNEEDVIYIAKIVNEVTRN